MTTKLDAVSLNARTFPPINKLGVWFAGERFWDDLPTQPEIRSTLKLSISDLLTNVATDAAELNRYVQCYQSVHFEFIQCSRIIRFPLNLPQSIAFSDRIRFFKGDQMLLIISATPWNRANWIVSLATRRQTSIIKQASNRRKFLWNCHKIDLNHQSLEWLV